MAISVASLSALQADLTRLWHDQPKAPVPGRDNPELLVAENHRRNFDLWHVEDEARRDDLGAEHVYRAKRSIDRLNQERNDYIQRLDEWFIQHLRPRAGGCPLSSETPGMMIDRLSILALKTYHMAIEAARTDASPDHRTTARQKALVLEQQRLDLESCLQALLDEVTAGKRTFKVYFQFKMYNDPAMNPALYRKKA